MPANFIDDNSGACLDSEVVSGSPVYLRNLLPMTRNIAALVVLSLLVSGVCCDRAWAVIAMDDASNAPYADGWQVTDNGGNGFAGWSTINNQSGVGSGGGFLATSNGSSQIDFNTKAWGLFGNMGGVGQAIRSLSTSMVPGNAFTLDMDNGFVDSGGTVGFGFQNASGNNVFEFFFVGGGSEYRVNRDGGSVGTGVSFTDTGLRLQLTLTDPNSFSFTIDKLSDGVGTNVTTVTGDLINAAGGQVISRIRLFNANAGLNEDHNVYFNSFLVTAVPEASAVWFGATAFVFAVGAALRRKQRPCAATCRV